MTLPSTLTKYSRKHTQVLDKKIGFGLPGAFKFAYGPRLIFAMNMQVDIQ